MQNENEYFQNENDVIFDDLEIVYYHDYENDVYNYGLNDVYHLNEIYFDGPLSIMLELFKIKNTIVTPSLTGSILSGVTRKSVIDLCKDLGFSVVERQISIDELVECGKNGTLEESFGSGTAAVISPISEFMWKDEKILVKDSSTSPVAMKLYEILTGIQTGKVEDKHNWTYVIK